MSFSTCGTSSAFGPVAAAIGTAALLTGGYEMVVSAGIAGGFRGRVAIGDVVLANLATYADLGVRVEGGFLSLRDMGIDLGVWVHAMETPKEELY